MSKITEFLDKQEGYNIECILKNEDHKLAIIELLKDFEKQLNIGVVSNSDSDVVADIRNKLGSVTALMGLVELRNNKKHKEYVNNKLDEALADAKDSIYYIRQL